jgi:hypothetical protein
MARAKHRWKRQRDQMEALIRKVERKVAHEKMLEEHRLAKKGTRPTTNVEEVVVNETSQA